MEQGVIAAEKRRPGAVKRTVKRKYLTETEVAALMGAARGRGRRYGHRDSTMILLAYRHGLRVGELVDVRWSDVDFDGARLTVRRLKNSDDAIHPLNGKELRALRKLRPGNPGGEFVFVTERGAPFTTSGFRKILTRVAEAAGLGALHVHPHMLRHACGFALVNKGRDTRTLQAFLGHRNIRHTVAYTALDARRFRGIWDD